MSSRYLPTGQPLVGLLSENTPSSVSPSAFIDFSSIFVSFGATSPTSSAIQTPRSLSPSCRPLVLNKAKIFGVSAANVVVGSSSGPVDITTWIFTSPRATETEMTAATTKTSKPRRKKVCAPRIRRGGGGVSEDEIGG